MERKGNPIPYRSTSQRKLFNAKAARGEISRATVAHWNKVSKGKKLPEYVSKPKRKGVTNMAKKRKKASKGGWSAAKLTAYKRAKRKLITAFNKKGAKGSVRVAVG